MRKFLQGALLRGAFVALVVSAISGQAQTIVLKDGRTIEGKNLRRNGAMVMTALEAGGGQGEMGVPFANIASIAFPEPPQIEAATKLLLAGKAAEALPQIEQLLAQQAPFKDVPGNWWARTALLHVSLLQALGREAQAGPEIDALAAYVADPEIVLAGKLKQAAILARKEPKKALPRYEEVLKESTQPEVLAEAWLNIGSVRLGLLEFQPALLAYLHLQVFYPGQKLLMPKALLGSSHAYAGLEDFARARDALDELLRDYPGSPEAVTAKSELPKMEKKLKGKAGTAEATAKKPSEN